MRSNFLPATLSVMSIDLAADRLNDRVARMIRAEMGARRLSQSWLGRMVGRSQNGISRRLSGAQDLTLNEVEDIAHALNVPVERLILTPDPLAAKRRRASLCQLV